MAKRIPKFEGREVTDIKMKITRAGDGLSKAMKIDPVVLHSGQYVDVVLRCKVGQIIFKPDEDTDTSERVQELRALMATIVDSDAVTEILEQHQKALDEAEGVLQFPNPGDEDADKPGDDWDDE